ncbi:MAG: hypothetical protein ACRDQZ_22905, partial [Mycobacteriales bacterium]
SWDLAVIRRGRLAAAATAPTTRDVLPTIERLMLTAETVLSAASVTGLEESRLLLRWLDRPETRVVSIAGTWTCPVRGAGRWEHLVRRLTPSVGGERGTAAGFDT